MIPKITSILRKNSKDADKIMRKRQLKQEERK